MAMCMMCELQAVELNRWAVGRQRRPAPKVRRRSQWACRRAQRRRLASREPAPGWPFSSWWDEALR